MAISNEPSIGQKPNDPTDDKYNIKVQFEEGSYFYGITVTGKELKEALHSGWFDDKQLSAIAPMIYDDGSMLVHDFKLKAVGVNPWLFM